MTRRLIPRWTLEIVTVAAVAGRLSVPVHAQAPSMAGVWRSNDTSIRVTVERNEAKGVFVEAGAGARALGFKPGDPSFTAAVMGNYLHGEQIIRYTGTCATASGRKVPMMGRLTPNGQSLAIHFYGVSIDANCRDTGEYTVSESLWQRAAAR